MWNFFFFSLIWFWKASLGYGAEAGSVFSGNIKFPEQHIFEREKLNSTAGEQWSTKTKHCSLNLANKNLLRIIICEVEHTKEYAINAICYSVLQLQQASIQFMEPEGLKL